MRTCVSACACVCVAGNQKGFYICWTELWLYGPVINNISVILSHIKPLLYKIAAALPKRHQHHAGSKQVLIAPVGTGKTIALNFYIMSEIFHNGGMVRYSCHHCIKAVTCTVTYFRCALSFHSNFKCLKFQSQDWERAIIIHRFKFLQVKSEEEIRRVFDDNWRIIFGSSP